MMSLPPVGTANPVGRNPGIDVVRGISIMLVVIHHTALRIPLPNTGLSAILPRRLLQGLSWDGYEAVFAFFVVSGFLITRSALTRWGTLARLDLHVFYVRRAARIMPCLIVLLAVLSLLDLLGTPNHMIERPDQSLPSAVFSALALHLNWYEGRTGYLPGGWDVLWSLSIEEMFYLGFPLICLTVGKYRTCLPVLMGVLAMSLPLELNALSRASDIWREKAYAPGFAAIAMGVLAALAASYIPVPKRKFLVSVGGWLGTVLIGAIFWREDLVYRLTGHGAMLVLTFGVALLMVAFHWGWGRQRTTDGTRWLRSFGLMSYEIYLTHMFVVFSIVSLFRSSGAGLYFGWLWFAPVLGLSWGLGRLVNHFLSVPADRWVRGWLTVSTPAEAPGSQVI